LNYFHRKTSRGSIVLFIYAITTPYLLGIYNQLNIIYMKNLFKMYRKWRNRKFVEKINKVYFKQDNEGNLFMEGSLYVYGKNNGVISSWVDKSLDDVKKSISDLP
jgi:hypothetical protein